ncbi:MAG: DNA polymerase/3'-5' exonuclease PolX [candidate division WS2 bacterium]|nr:DNA polymerase/3'-5' exonuclease PolX [Candidatus Psychracetigena formicireducens]
MTTGLKVSRILEKIALYLEMKGENPFKIRAYQKASGVISNDYSFYEGDELLHQIKSTPGIGEKIYLLISEAIHTGKSLLLEKLEEEINPGVLSFLKIPGVGPRTAYNLYKNLYCYDLKTLKHILLTFPEPLPGISENLRKKLLAGIELVLNSEQLLLPLDIETAVYNYLHKMSLDTSRFEIAGDFRRGEFVSRSATIIIEDLTRPETEYLEFDNPIPLRVVLTPSFIPSLFFHTGPEDEYERVKDKLLTRGFNLTSNELYSKSGRKIPLESEEELYNLAETCYYPPELRSVSWRNEYQKDLLIDLPDIKGDFQTHSTWSDGAQSIKEIHKIASRLGYEYIAITDHSKSLKIAGGLNEDEFLELKKEIDSINSKNQGTYLLWGGEIDILKDGSLDLEENILKLMDWPIGAIHSNFSMDKDKMTERMVKAIRNPYLKGIVHPTGRILKERLPYQLDIDFIIKEAVKYNKYLEVNSQPFRLDLDVDDIRKVKAVKGKVFLGTDAHSPLELNYIRYGIALLKKSCFPKHDILNTYNLKQLKSALHESTYT